MKKEHLSWISAFLENASLSNKSPHTLINYACDLKHFMDWFEANSVGTISLANSGLISAYQKHLTEGGLVTPKVQEDLPEYLQKVLKNPRYLWMRTLAMCFAWFLYGTTSSDLPLLQVHATRHQPLSVAARKRHLSTIKTFFEYLKQTHEDTTKLFATNPVKSTLHSIKLKDEDVLHTQYLPPDDWLKIKRSVFRPREVLIIHLLYWGGLRLSEVSSLRADALNYSTGVLTFVRKGGSIHELLLQNWEVIVKQWENHLWTRSKDSMYLFPGQKGDSPITSRAMFNLLKKMMDKAKCATKGITPHSFRKACATELYKKTKDLLLVRDYLNHADAKVTQTYIARMSKS